MSQNFRTKAAIGGLLAAFAYYICYRWLQLPLNDLSAGSFPSFIFVFAFGLLLPKLPTKWQAPYQSHWLLLVLVTEPLFGVATWLDGLAAILGYFSAITFLKYSPTPTNKRKPNPILFALVPLLLIGSYWKGDGLESDYTPVYMSYAELRSSVVLEDPRTMSEMGRLITYQDYLFVNELNKGLHVINNTNPSVPEAVGFIKIPGNTDVSIRDGFLYADSYIDLVVIDIRDPANVVEINRKTDVFPWNQYQAVGTGEWFDADKDRGVVVALVRRSN